MQVGTLDFYMVRKKIAISPRGVTICGHAGCRTNCVLAYYGGMWYTECICQTDVEEILHEYECQ